MTPATKRYLLLGLLVAVIAICLIPSCRSRLLELVRPRPTQTAPANDRFENAEVISGRSGVVARSNAGAGTQPDEPNHRGLPPCKSIWFRWTAPAEGGVAFDTMGSAIPSVLAVYETQTFQGITAAPKIILNRENDYRQFVFNAEKDRLYYIVVNGRDCVPGAPQKSGDVRQENRAAEMSEPKASPTPADDAASGTIRLEWEMQSSRFLNVTIKGRVKDAACTNVGGVTLTVNPCGGNCVETTNNNGRYTVNGYSPPSDFTITPSHTGFNFIPEPGHPCQDPADFCTWTTVSCVYPRNTGNLFNANYRAFRNPTLTYSAAANRDCVGRGDAAVSPDMVNDGVFELQFPAGSTLAGAQRAITKMELLKTSNVLWDTAPNMIQVLGVSKSAAGACVLLNNPNGSLDPPNPGALVPVQVSSGDTLYLFAADLNPQDALFTSGTFEVKIYFQDGGVATARFTIVPAASPTVTVSP